MPNNRYLMSFTAGSLLYQESLTLAALYEEQASWRGIRERVLAGNLLQVRTDSAARRIFREVSARLNELTSTQMHLLLEGSLQEQKYLLWLAICKRYQFIYDFATEVVREKALRLNMELSYEDYDVFFNNKAEWHPEVEHVAPSTRGKLRQVLFLMLREAGLLSSDNVIMCVVLTPSLEAAIGEDNPAEFAVFPLANPRLDSWTP